MMNFHVHHEMKYLDKDEFDAVWKMAFNISTKYLVRAIGDHINQNQNFTTINRLKRLLYLQPLKHIGIKQLI